MSKSRSFVRLFVGFILTATGVHTSCPIELSPSTVVVRYGDPVSINCSTSDSQVELMGWEVTQGATGMQPVKHLTWTLKSLTEWTIDPSCFINLSPDRTPDQCDKRPKVVLYTFPENIGISSSSGSDGVNFSLKENEEYNFRCDIKHVAPVQNLTVRWYKGDTMIYTDTFNNPIKKPVNTSSSLNYTATRQDNGVTFRCKAHMDLRPEGPQLHVSSQDYIITVNFGPDVQCSHIELLEGETLESKCPVVGNPVPFVRWLKDGQSVNLSVPLSRENAGNYSIYAEGFSSIDKTVEVLVLYKPELNCPSTYTAPEFTPHNISCTVEGYPEPEITWSKDGEETFPDILTRHDAGHYVITASNALSSVNATLEITVIYPPSQIVELEDSEVEIGSDVWLKCSSMGNPRPKYLWNYYRMPNVKEEGEDGVSRLLIHNATAYNMGSYTCYSSNERGNVSKTVRLTVRGAKQECPIEISPNRMVIQYRGPSQIAKCTNTTEIGNYVEKFWQVTSDIRNNNESWSADTLKDWDVRPSCKATIVGIGKCEKSLYFTLYKTPDSVLISADVSSVMEDREFQLQCDIINVAPAGSLAVRWYRGNDAFEPLVKRSMQVSGCVPENNTNCNISLIRTPVNVSSTIRTVLNRKYMSVQFRCEAELNLGPEGPQSPPNMMSSPLNITVHFKPVINTTKIPKAMPVFRGYPEELVCEAEGHPSPKIQWLYSSDKVAHVSGNTLTVSEAGLYNCTATNEFGSSFHVVEVILKEDYLPLIAGFVAVTVVAISVVFLFIYSIYYKNTKMRRYSLKNPKFGNHNGNVAHNGWDLQFPMTTLS